MNKRQQNKYIKQAKISKSVPVIFEEDKSKRVMRKSIRVLRWIIAIVSVIMSTALLAALIYAIVIFFRADWVQTIIAALN
ncbi:MAG: hypothetical protein EOM87_09720 [Clostridia bacterium]|nr:hypothetical protein [Clostridia bacterium]